MNLANRLNDIQEYYFSKKLREIDSLNTRGKNVINLGIGSPDLPPHISVIETLAEESAKPTQHSYQNYKGSPVLRNAMADWYANWYDVRLDAEAEILPLIGSKEGIMHICMTFLQEGDSALIPNPGYPTYAAAVKLAGAIPVSYDLLEENNWMPDLEVLGKLVKLHKCKLLFVNYPHMPTGKLPDIGLFEKLVVFAKQQGLLIVHDNPYSFILNDKPQSILSVPGAIDVAMELNSLSKSHNMAGWRVGMLVGSSTNINSVLRFKSNMDSGMFLPLQLAAAKALQLGDNWYHSLNVIYHQRQAVAFELLTLLDCTFEQKQAGLFVWGKVKNEISTNNEMGRGGNLSDTILYQANVFITPGGIFGTNGKDYIRVSLCSPAERLKDAINRIKDNL